MNPYETANRLRKVQTLTDRIWADLSSFARLDPDTPFSIANADADWWALAAKAAGVNEPSDLTREAVVEALCRRVNAERKMATTPCDECSGTGTESVRGGGGGEPEWDGERDCEHCDATGALRCELCRGDLCDGRGVVVTPLGLYSLACAEREYPEVARHARMLRDPFAGLNGEATHAGESNRPVRASEGRRPGEGRAAVRGRKVAG